MKKTNIFINKAFFAGICLITLVSSLSLIGCGSFKDVYSPSSYTIGDFLVDPYESKMETLQGYKGYSGKVIKISPANGVNWTDFSKAIYREWNQNSPGQQHITISMSVLVESPDSDKSVTSAYKPVTRVWASPSDIRWKGPGNLGWTIQSGYDLYEAFGDKPVEVPYNTWTDLTFSQSVDFIDPGYTQLYLDGHNDGRGLVDLTVYIRHFEVTIGGSGSGKFIALTFNDGPTDFTPYLLDKLAELGVKASFFVLGSGIDAAHPVFDQSIAVSDRPARSLERKALMKRMVDEGHNVSTLFDSYTSSLSETAIRNELEKTRTAIQKSVYGDTDYQKQPWVSKHIRIPSGLDKSANLNRAAILLDLPIVNGFGEARPQNSPERIAEALLNEAEPWGVIINRDPRSDPTVVNVLEILIPRLKAEGYQFVTLSNMIQRRRASLIAGDVYNNLDPEAYTAP